MQRPPKLQAKEHMFCFSYNIPCVFLVIKWHFLHFQCVSDKPYSMKWVDLYGQMIPHSKRKDFRKLEARKSMVVIMMGFLQIVLILSAFIAAFAGISLFLYFCLSAIKNHFINKIVLVIFCILFLPCMLFLWSTGKITEKEKVLFPFLSFNLRARSRIVLFATAVYAIIYYALFQIVFY